MKYQRQTSVKDNIVKLRKEGKPMKQAIVIALRKSRKKRR